ncbi:MULTISPECIES: hypothetical protein [Streptomyces]|uniref:hypothetical protein n=1 Tax=Streptomyces TaxID=1883 RepID=UPI0004CD2E03|nr:MULTISPECIES: hypothetical protein [Streptomyces]KOT65823.1 hypothetical protein ADK43_02565 [Streptomyces rimosus subsp. rimosus]
MAHLLGCSELDHELVREFAPLLKAGDADLTLGWLDHLTACRAPTLVSLTKGVYEDQAAVAQG